MDEDEETEASEDDPEPPASEPEQTISAGERVSLRDEAFEPLIYACDNQINNALRVAVETGKGFTFTAKISFEAQSGGLFNISHETGYQFDPIKIKNKGTLYEPLRIVLDENGVPIIPYDREHQITLAESMSQPPAATVTARKKKAIRTRNRRNRRRKIFFLFPVLTPTVHFLARIRKGLDVCSVRKNLSIPTRRIGIVSARQRIADARGIV